MSSDREAGERRLPVVARVAREVLVAGVGNRMPTAVELQARLGVGSGTVQKALAELKTERAVELRSRGALGTFVEQIDVPLLWQLGLLGPVHMLVPATDSAEMRLLIAATARVVREAIGTDLTVGVHPGAARRLDLVRAGVAHCAVMSSGAYHGVTGSALEMAADVTCFDEQTVVSLGPYTYYHRGSVVVVAREADPARWRRIGVDRNSSDHQRLSDAEFGTWSTIVDTGFATIPARVLDGTVDAGIWHRVPTMFAPEDVGLTLVPLRGSAVGAVADSVSAAVLVALTAEPFGAVLRGAQIADLVAALSAPADDASGIDPVALRVVV